MTRPRFRDLGFALGVLRPGPRNAITDVPGVRVGHSTIVRGDGRGLRSCDGDALTALRPALPARIDRS
ncbi:MAG: hypothetical protein KGJ98_05795 [Chloroflexota bacterium]|nr:hypothetical protein [Chloroflexota bacterium]